MNPSDWRKAAALVSKHKEAAATAANDQLNSMPLSKISIDDSNPPVVHYGSHMPVEDNYFDSIIISTNTLPILEVEEQVDLTSDNNLVPATQEFIDEKESAINIPESQKIDIGYSSQWQAVSNTISNQDIDLDANLPDDQLQDKEEEDPTDQDTLVYDTDVCQDEYYSTVIDIIYFTIMSVNVSSIYHHHIEHFFTFSCWKYCFQFDR